MTDSNAEPLARVQEEYPTNTVFGLVDDAKAAEAIVSKLEDMPLNEDSINILCDEAAAEQLKEYRQEHPIKARINHAMSLMSNESELIDQYNQRLTKGELIVSAEVEDDEQAETVAEVMRQHGASYINYFGSQVITTLEP